MAVNKVSWQQVGHVTEPGRYMYRFGWLTIIADDLAIWKQFPDASFTLVQTLSPPLAAGTDADEAPTVEIEEYHLGAFELPLPDPPDRDHFARVDEEAIALPSEMELQSSL